jgi:hypothetical protein
MSYPIPSITTLYSQTIWEMSSLHFFSHLHQARFLPTGRSSVQTSDTSVAVCLRQAQPIARYRISTGPTLDRTSPSRHSSQ